MADRLGELLVAQGLLTADQVRQALAEQQTTGEFLGRIAVRRGWISDEQLLDALSRQFHIPQLHLREATIAHEVIEALPAKLAWHYKVLPVRLQDDRLTIALTKPQDVHLLDELALALNHRYQLEAVLASEWEVLEGIKRYYGVGSETIEQLLQHRVTPAEPAAAEERVVEDIEKLAEDASVIKLVNQVIVEAYQKRATDIHLEPYRARVRLRYRIDGILQEADVSAEIRRFFPAIISRIKIMSNLNIVERRLPQDGRASVRVSDQKLDLRISTLPTAYGESIVIRILPSAMLLSLEDLGLRPQDLATLAELIRKPHGILFVTGPTGSGKTTTLYACLSQINTTERKIVTIEDPIEYELEGLTQLQVMPQINLTFAQGLRSMLRHDPDVMMVGEVRDLETAELAIRIALTGHLVFSTLHTNDAASGVTRLLDMGIDPYLIVSAVECFIAQRLVRLICTQCKAAETAPAMPAVASLVQELGGARRASLERIAWSRGRGCDACAATGYRGRTAIYEFLRMTPEIRDLILRQAPIAEIQRTAQAQGMQSLRQSGWDKAAAGFTTPEEILRVTQE